MKANAAWRVPVHSELWEILKRGAELLRPAGAELVLGREVKKPHSPLAKALKALGLPAMEFHSLRRSYGTWIDARFQRGIVRPLLAHASTDMTDRYSLASMETLRRAVEEMPALLTEKARELAMRFWQQEVERKERERTGEDEDPKIAEMRKVLENV
jgi:integrase